MSLFDELLVEYPLPDGWDPGTAIFQTKDTPDPYLTRYRLRADGSLVDDATGKSLAFHGALTFYAGNVSGTGPEGFVTQDDAPPWWAEYTALYDHGTLLKLEGGKRADTTLHGPHLTRQAWHQYLRQRPMPPPNAEREEAG